VKKEIVIIVAALAAVAVALVWRAGRTGEGSKDDMVLGFAQSSLQSLYYKTQVETARDYAHRLGLELRYVSCEYDVQKQLSQVQDFIARKVDAVIINPADSNGLGPAVEACNGAGIPVVCLDRKIFGGKLDAGFVSDNFMAGRQAAEYLGQIAKGEKLRILNLQGNFSDRNAIERDNGFKEGMKAFPNMEIVAEIATEWNQQKAANGAQSALLAHPEINALFWASDYLGPSVISVLRSLDRLHPRGEEGHLLIAGVDGDPFGVEMILKGYQDCDSSQGCIVMAKEAVDACVAMAGGEQPTHRIAEIPTTLIHAGNIEAVGATGEQWGWLVYQQQQAATE
jgi:ABC-type sugar transport system substrate-binding protein